MSQAFPTLSRTIGIAVCTIALPAVVLARTTAQTTTQEQTINFEIVGVDGNKVIVKGASGTKEVTATDDMKFTVDGRQVTYRDLKPGMKGTARITTTTTVIPVHVTEVKTGEVLQASGNSIIVRTDNGIKMFSEADVSKRNVTIMKDGQPAHISDFHAGDRLAATIVTTGTPKVMTQRQVDAVMSGAPVTSAARSSAGGAAASGGAPPNASSSGSAGASASSGSSSTHSGRKLPKTATSNPAVGASGALLLSLGVVLTLARRRSL